MPFTQAEVEEAFGIAWSAVVADARRHGMYPHSLGVRPPIIGTVRMRCPVDGSACHDLFCQRNGCQGAT